MSSIKINKHLFTKTGTWIPTLKGTTTAGTGTYTLRYGTYTKIGNVLFYDFKIGLSAFSGGSGYFQIGGLPYNNVKPNTTNLSTVMCSGDIFAGDFVRTLWWSNGLLISLDGNGIGGLSATNITSATYLYASGVMFLTN